MLYANYVYLVSTLPMLHFGLKPPFSFEKFLEISSRYAPDEDMETLKNSSISGEYDRGAAEPFALKGWRDFDTTLRNELVKIRSSHKRLDPAKYMRHDERADSYIAHIVMTSHRNPSILEGERMLDEARWDALDELEAGRWFDLDILIIYAHKLLILERWERIETAEKERLLEELVKQ